VRLLVAERRTRSEPVDREVEARSRAARQCRAAVGADRLADLPRRRPLQAVAEDAAEAGDVVADDVLAVDDDPGAERVVAGRLAMGGRGCSRERGAEDGGARQCDEPRTPHLQHLSVVAHIPFPSR
jgi:hypothetical protein